MGSKVSSKPIQISVILLSLQTSGPCPCSPACCVFQFSHGALTGKTLSSVCSGWAGAVSSQTLYLTQPCLPLAQLTAPSVSHFSTCTMKKLRGGKKSGPCSAVYLAQLIWSFKISSQHNCKMFYYRHFFLPIKLSKLKMTRNLESQLWGHSVMTWRVLFWYSPDPLYGL